MRINAPATYKTAAWGADGRFNDSPFNADRNEEDVIYYSMAADERYFDEVFAVVAVSVARAVLQLQPPFQSSSLTAERSPMPTPTLTVKPGCDACVCFRVVAQARA